MRERTALPVFALVVAALLFGITFVVVKSAVAEFPPLAFVAWRFLIGAAVLLVLAVPRRARLWRDGAAAGALLFAGFALQTTGLTTTGATNSALITGLYVVFTPIVVAVWRKALPSPWVVIGTVVAFLGLALVTFDDTLHFASGDLLTLGCAVAFAGHIAYLARVAHRHPVVPFTAVQLLIVSVLGFAISIPFEGVQVPSGSQWQAIVLTGAGVAAIAFLLQVWAQTRLGPSRTAVILTLEPVFGVAAGALILAERLTVGGWFGALLILVAIQLVLAKASGDDTTAAESVSPVH